MRGRRQHSRKPSASFWARWPRSSTTRIDMSGKTTEKASGSKPRPPRDDMRREYRFAYREARPNRFAAMLKGGTTAVVLDPDVASVFASPEAGNRLRGLIITELPANVSRVQREANAATARDERRARHGK